MATLVLTTVGTALGGSLGGALGGLVGQSIDQQIFGSERRKGPRLGDLSVQTSSYGSPIPRIYGTMRVAGTVIWATDLKEEEEIEGGGKSGPEQVTYRYSADLAVALSSRPIREIRRIWADGKLIRGAGGDFKVKTGFRLHRGDEDQAVDPLIASVETISQTPAYRGLALAIFEELQLAEFGNRIPMLTFEVVADEAEVTLSAILNDASAGLISANDERPIPGFAAHGTSVRDSISGLIELTGLDLAERDDLLRDSPAGSPLVVQQDEQGCDAESGGMPRAELHRAADSSQPTSVTMNYYDPERDYQTGQVRASSGTGGARDERVELPAVIYASQARKLVEQTLAPRWRRGDQLSLRLPPSRMGLRPGDPLQIAGTSRTWLVRSVSIEGMAVAVVAEAAPVTIPVLAADPGRSISEPDLIVGRSEIALFELPAAGDAPDSMTKVHIAGANAGQWKQLPVTLALGAEPNGSVAVARRAVLGITETALDPRAPLIMDDLSSVVVRLANQGHYLLNADMDALMGGRNLAAVGNELLQFARAEQLEPGIYRLSGLLRGRRGTEWAAAEHSAGEPFCLFDHSSLVAIDLPAGSVGANLTAVAHGIGDVAPLPTAQRAVTGESLRPPSPCHLRLVRMGDTLVARWTRRSHRGWAWVDGVEVSEDPFPERYRLSITGPGGVLMTEPTSPAASFALAQLPGQAGDLLHWSIETVGPTALSHQTSASITI